MQRFPWLSGFYRTSNEPVKSFLHCARRGLRDASSEDQRLLPVCCGQLLVLLLLLRTIARLDSLVGEEGGEKKNPKKTNGNWRCRPRAGSRGGGTAVRHERRQIPSWQWNVSVVWGAKCSQWKVVSLTSVCLGPKDRGNGVGRIK